MLVHLREPTTPGTRVTELERVVAEQGEGVSRLNRQRRLRELEQRPQPDRAQRRSTRDLACFTDEDLELMILLAAKLEVTGMATVWTDEELVALERLAQVEQRCHSSS